jgi:hypothetical protein
MVDVTAAELVWVELPRNGERPTSIFEKYLPPPAPRYDKGIEMAMTDFELYRLTHGPISTFTHGPISTFTHGPISTFTTFLTALED